MNKQDAFNKVWDWAVVKKNPKAGSEISCYYRGPNSTKCFVGVLIPDSLYSPDMENNSASDMIKEYPELLEYLSINVDKDPDELSFLDELQNVHDSYPPNRWEEKLSLLAKVHGLVVPS